MSDPAFATSHDFIPKNKKKKKPKIPNALHVLYEGGALEHMYAEEGEIHAPGFEEDRRTSLGEDGPWAIVGVGPSCHLVFSEGQDGRGLLPEQVEHVSYSAIPTHPFSSHVTHHSSCMTRFSLSHSHPFFSHGTPHSSYVSPHVFLLLRSGGTDGGRAHRRVRHHVQAEVRSHAAALSRVDEPAVRVA